MSRIQMSIKPQMSSLDAYVWELDYNMGLSLTLTVIRLNPRKSSVMIKKQKIKEATHLWDFLQAMLFKLKK